MLRAIAASLLIAQTLIVPMTGARTRNIQTETLFHTLFHDFFLEDDGTTYVQTGDIPAMWLRDSSAQTIPYVRFQSDYPLLRARFAGVIERNARAIDKDVYANAFQEDYHAWERKWEVDSIAWPVVLIVGVLRRDARPHAFLRRTCTLRCGRSSYTYNCEEHHRECSQLRLSLSRPDTSGEFDEGTGLIWGAFRPSDDPVEYRFNIPQNVLAAVALRDISARSRASATATPA